MVSIQNISISFAGQKLFDDITFTVNPKERIGLAGKNGVGKTTLLKIIKGELQAETGNIILPEGTKIGYLPQEKKIKSNKSVLEETLSVFDHVHQLKKLSESIANELSQRTDYENNSYLKLIERLNEVNHQIDLLSIEKSEGNAERILKGLGFKQHEFPKPVTSFSFGWQMRIELAKLLLQQPGLLLLDEPTNHLDIDSIQWLENLLLTYRGSIILVSHDRTFLDTLTTRTIEINNGRIYDYKVPYSQFIKLRNERIDQQKAAFDNQQKELRQIEQFIERFRYKASKAKQVQSRIKKLDKLDKINIDAIDNKTIHFLFPPAPRSGKVTVEGKHISKYYGEKRVLKDIEFQIIRGEKLSFVGRNGEGKSTLAKIIAGKLDYEGSIKYGNNVQIAYYAQDQWEMLHGDDTVFETLDKVAVGEVRKRLTNILGSFLFRGEDINKKVKILSGGEKARLSLAKLLLTPSNLLILDEPTNHLDLTSKDILKNALLQYEGTLIVVSHDRDFLEGLTTRHYEFKNNKIKEFRGDIREFLQKRKMEHLNELEKDTSRKKRSEKTDSEAKVNWKQKKELDKKIKKLRNESNTIQEQIEALENELSVIQKKLSDPDNYQAEIESGSLYKEYSQKEKELKTLYDKWEHIEAAIEKWI